MYSQLYISNPLKELGLGIFFDSSPGILSNEYWELTISIGIIHFKLTRHRLNPFHSESPLERLMELSEDEYESEQFLGS